MSQDIMCIVMGILLVCSVILLITNIKYSKENGILKYDFKNIKENYDNEYEHIKRQKSVIREAQENIRIDREIFDKEKANWCTINKFREERRDNQLKEMSVAADIARLEGKKEGLVDSLKSRDELTNEYKVMVTELMSSVKTLVSNVSCKNLNNYLGSGVVSNVNKK